MPHHWKAFWGHNGMAKGPPAPHWRIQSKCTAFFWSINKEQRSAAWRLRSIRFFFSWNKSFTQQLILFWISSTRWLNYFRAVWTNSNFFFFFVEGKTIIFPSAGPFITLQDSHGLKGARRKTNGNRRLWPSRRVTSEMPHFPLPIHRCGLSKSGKLTRACLRRAPTQVSPLLGRPALPWRCSLLCCPLRHGAFVEGELKRRPNEGEWTAAGRKRRWVRLSLSEEWRTKPGSEVSDAPHDFQSERCACWRTLSNLLFTGRHWGLGTGVIVIVL